MEFSLSSPNFLYIIKNSKSLKSRDLFIRYKKNDKPKLGLVVSRKYGNAVQRNLFKRRCRNLFKLCLVKNNLNFSIIIFPKNGNISFFDIKKSFNSLHEKLVN